MILPNLQILSLRSVQFDFRLCFRWVLIQMEKRNSIDERFINLREIFHDFQTSVRFSTSSLASQIFANHLKCYQFLGELQQHFNAERVPQLYEFVHSIFSLIFTMIREGPSQRHEKIIEKNKTPQHDVGVQTQTKQDDERKKVKVDMINFVNNKHRKRSCLEIQIFQKDLTEMDFRQRRRALKKMRDIIYSEDEVSQPNNFLKEFKPNIQKIGYSKSDESIKSALDKFKQSDISTDIFLKHFMSEFIEIKDIKSSSELLNKDLLRSISKTVHKYRNVKVKQKQKLKTFSHMIEQIIYPTFSGADTHHQNAYRINIRKDKTRENNDQWSGPQKTQNQNHQTQANHNQIGLLQIITKSKKQKQKQNQKQKQKQKLKRNKFPSLLIKDGQTLHSISQIKSQSSKRSQKSSNSGSTEKTSGNRKNIIKMTPESEFQIGEHKRSPKQKVNLRDSLELLPKQKQPQKPRSRSSFRNYQEGGKQNVDLLQKQTLKQKSNFSKLRKRGGSQHFPNMQARFNRKSLQAN